MAGEFFEVINNCLSNLEIKTFTVISGEGFSEKAVISGGAIVYLSKENGFLSSHKSELNDFTETGIFRLVDSSVYAEIVTPEKKIVICGAGHVSMPVIRLAKMTGFKVTVIDDRPDFVNNAKNAGADVVVCDEFENALANINGDNDTFFVIVTRGHQYDSECLRAVLKKSYAYVGMMGSKRRVRIVKEQLLREGFDSEAVNNLRSPIGLAINAETPEEIAVSIMAEIIKVKNQAKNIVYPREILNSLFDDTSSERKILCTIVMKKGAAPRETGAKMIYTSSGKIIGTIGGGCTEAEVIRKAREMFLQSRPEPVLMRVNLTADEAAQEGEVCGGIIDVWLESVS